MTTTQIHKVVNLSQIVADANQPRKLFDVNRLAELIASIKEHGIMNPVVVEDLKNGKFLLVDGERRFRAASELKLKTIPVLIQSKSTDVERTIKQFHLQEQHEGWTPVEKAVAVGYLAQELGMSPRALARTLSLPERTIGDYEAFYSLLERGDFQKNEISVQYARHINAICKKAKSLYEAVYEKEFDTDMRRALEKKLIASIKKGEIARPVDITKLRDAFVKEPDTIEKYIKSNASITKLYLDSDAKVARHARNVAQLANILTNHISQVIALNGVALVVEDEYAVHKIKDLKKKLDTLVAQI